MIAWTLFWNPVILPSASHLWLLLPLLGSVAIVYKTIRTHDIRCLPFQVLAVMAYMAGGLTALAVGLWVVHEYWPF